MIPLRDNVRSRTIPVMNILIIILNIVMFFRELGLSQAGLLEPYIYSRGVIPARLLSVPWIEWPTIFSSMFLHGGWSHLIGNMLYLWIFGDNVEDRVGHFRFLVFYVSVGIIAAVGQSLLFPTSRVPMIGASGAIAGVLGAYFVLYPNAKVLTLVPIWVFIRIVEFPAYFLLGFWFVIQYFQGLGSITQAGRYGDVGGGVAWWAHASGFISGLVLIWFFKKSGRRR